MGFYINQWYQRLDYLSIELDEIIEDLKNKNEYDDFTLEQAKDLIETWIEKWKEDVEEVPPPQYSDLLIQVAEIIEKDLKRWRFMKPIVGEENFRAQLEIANRLRKEADETFL